MKKFKKIHTDFFRFSRIFLLEWFCRHPKIRKRSLSKTVFLITLLKTVQKMYDTRASRYVSVGNDYLVGYCTYMWIPF